MLVSITLLTGACAAEGVRHEDEEPAGQVTAALADGEPVSAAIASSECSTTLVKGLATQLVEEIQCLSPGTMKRIDDIDGIKLGAAVFPYLQTPAADALIAAQKVRKVPLEMNSGLRTLPQQFLLYRWSQQKRCGITLAARPGSSNHESATAIDIDDNAAWRSALQGKGFKWLGPSDEVHYDFSGKTVDLKGLSVQAFQRLWNRNHPEDKIGEDGDYGDDTEKRLARAPANGFPQGAKCDPAAAEKVPPATEAPKPGEQPTTSTNATEPEDDESDEASSRRRLVPASTAGCSTHGSTTRPNDLLPFALVAIGVAFARRRIRT